MHRCRFYPTQTNNKKQITKFLHHSYLTANSSIERQKRNYYFSRIVNL